MTTQHHILFWSLTSILFLGFIALFKAILLPFVLGMTVAYLLAPSVKKCVSFNIKRSTAAFLIVAAFYVVISALVILIMPVIYREITSFIEDMPYYLEFISNILEPYSDKVEMLMGPTSPAAFADSATDIGASIASYLAASSMALLDVLSLAIITPIMAYFMMKEWEGIIQWFEDLLPKHMKTTIKELFSQINAKLSGFIRGQISVALVLGVIYAVALTIAGLEYGFLIGLLAGALSIIPMLGSVIGLITAVIIAAFQSEVDLSFMAIIAAIFIVGQIIEGHILTPRLVGRSVGLHPLWIFFALMAGGSLFGIVGMLIAVPVAAIISVFVVFGINSYKAGSYYKTAKTEKAEKSAKIAKMSQPAPSPTPVVRVAKSPIIDGVMKMLKAAMPEIKVKPPKPAKKAAKKVEPAKVAKKPAPAKAKAVKKKK